MRKIKKILGTILLSAMVFSVAGNASVFASNYQDTSFGFNFDNSQLYTAARAKTDYTSMYMKCNSITKNTSYTAHAVGANSRTATTWIDCSRGNTYTFKSAGETHFMLNWVKENGYPYAKIAANPDYGYKFSASGLWSPDSV